ncbi:hypothetical protein QCA50_003518 [Cerrena zonata]|uniref:AB hydrolase-1 domain-containing protein n=1 Tax=Cerrena zonata TaxID=2478898 RepID=A0AAW0GQ31_9APHY
MSCTTLTRPVVVIAHGLTGGSHEHYVRAAVSVLTASVSSGGLGARIVVMNFRGCNNSPVTTPKLYHGGSSYDIRSVVLWVTHTFPQSTLFGIGFSLGANIFTKYVCEEGGSCPLSGLVSLANPWDFQKGGVYTESGSLMSRFVYRYVLGGALQALYHRNRAIFLTSPQSTLSTSVLENLFARKRISLVEFDHTITAVAWGFKDAWDYYANISSPQFLDALRIPLLGINALDDPIMGCAGLPREEAKKNPWFVLVATKRGGHLGWFERHVNGGLGRWYVKPVKEYFQALLECDPSPRPKPTIIVNNNGLLQDKDRPDVAVAEVLPDSLETFTSGDGESKLFSGW